jgi:membrane protease YdiL (CAAX protease family)
MMPPIFFLSLCLGYIYERTANLWAPITVHLMFNLASVTIFVSSV